MSNAQTTREALLGQMLEDVDKVADRLETIEKGITEKIATATEIAFGKAFLTVTMRYEKMIETQSAQLVETAKKATGMIRAELSSAALPLGEAARRLRKQAIVWMTLAALIGVVSGAAGVGITTYVITASHQLDARR